MELVTGNQRVITTGTHNIPFADLQGWISHVLGLDPEEFYLISNGRRLTANNAPGKTTIHMVPRVLGGKGGFGSMLRAIGAQIEKTTNREACRDLSGRRLRDINEEQRLKKWVGQQAEREKEAKEKKKKKLEKLLEQPKHQFHDEEYDKERSALPEKVEDAVLQGIEASCSSTKRKMDDKSADIPKKKLKLWIHDELDEDLSSSGSESEEDEAKQQSSSSPAQITEIKNNEAQPDSDSNEKSEESITIEEKVESK